MGDVQSISFTFTKGGKTGTMTITDTTGNGFDNSDKIKFNGDASVFTTEVINEKLKQYGFKDSGNIDSAVAQAVAKDKKVSVKANTDYSLGSLANALGATKTVITSSISNDDFEARQKRMKEDLQEIAKLSFTMLFPYGNNSSTINKYQEVKQKYLNEIYGIVQTENSSSVTSDGSTPAFELVGEEPNQVPSNTILQDGNSKPSSLNQPIPASTSDAPKGGAQTSAPVSIPNDNRDGKEIRAEIEQKIAGAVTNQVGTQSSLSDASEHGVLLSIAKNLNITDYKGMNDTALKNAIAEACKKQNLQYKYCSADIDAMVQLAKIKADLEAIGKGNGDITKKPVLDLQKESYETKIEDIESGKFVKGKEKDALNQIEAINKQINNYCKINISDISSRQNLLEMITNAKQTLDGFIKKNADSYENYYSKDLQNGLSALQTRLQELREGTVTPQTASDKAIVSPDVKKVQTTKDLLANQIDCYKQAVKYLKQDIGNPMDIENRKGAIILTSDALHKLVSKTSNLPSDLQTDLAAIDQDLQNLGITTVAMFSNQSQAPATAKTSVQNADQVKISAKKGEISNLIMLHVKNNTPTIEQWTQLQNLIGDLNLLEPGKESEHKTLLKNLTAPVQRRPR